MQPRDPLAALKEDYSKKLAPNVYMKWLTSVQNLLKLMAMKEDLKKTTSGYVPPEENLKNLTYETKLTEKILAEQRKLEKIIGPESYDIIYKLEGIAKNPEISAKSKALPEKAKSAPPATSSRKGLFSKQDDTAKRRESAPTITVNNKKVNPGKVHKEGGAYDLKGPKSSKR